MSEQVGDDRPPAAVPVPPPWRGRLQRLARALLVVVVALTSAGLALAAWGSSSRDIGPLETRLSVVLDRSGGVAVGVPPLGRLSLPTHRGPLQVRATVTGIDPERASALLRARNPGRTVTEQVTRDSQSALASSAARSLLVALAVSALTCAVAFRRVDAVLAGTAAVAVVAAASTAVAWATLRTEALNEPRFEGLLAQAPAIIGRVDDFDAYGDRVARLTANVAQVYVSLATLPAAPAEGTTRVLWVSDIHNNPESFPIMRRLVEQFDVQAIVDTGDIVDVGSVLENRPLTAIGRFGIPYVYVRGNHDSRAVTQAFVAAQPGARVLDDGAVVEVAGVRFAGIGDPLFRPNKSVQGDADSDALRAAGERLRAAIEAAPEPVDVALVHEPAMAEPLRGAVPLVLDGHTHKRASRVDEGTLELTQGSSGGAGLRTLDEGDPLPLQMSILNFSPDGALLAVDDVTVGGLGQNSVTVERRSVASYGEGAEALPTPTPTPTP